MTWMCSLTYQFLGDSGKSYPFPKHFIFLNHAPPQWQRISILIPSFLMNCSVPTKRSHGKWGKTISFSDHTQTMWSLSTPLSSAIHYLIFCSSLSSFLPFHFLFHGLSFDLGSFRSTPVLLVLVSDSLLLPSVLHRTSAQCVNCTQQMCFNTCAQALSLGLPVFFQPFQTLWWSRA